MIKVNAPRYQSSFLSVDKDLSTIIDKTLSSNKLKKLLFYTTGDALEQKDLNEDQSLELINKNIKIIPKIKVDEGVLNYLIIGFDNFTPNGNNPYFRDNVIFFDIICHFDQWQLKDSQLRPFRIAGEIDRLFNNSKLSGIGTLNFMTATQFVLNDEFSGITLMYQAIHGDEDKRNPLNKDLF